MNTNHLINANALRNSNIQKRAVREYVIEIIKKIDEEIQTAHRNGENQIITDIPIIYDIPNMSNSDAQRAVWCSIIELLKEKGYRAWISPSPASCKLKITWISAEEEKQIKHQTQILAQHTDQF